MRVMDPGMVPDGGRGRRATFWNEVAAAVQRGGAVELDVGDGGGFAHVHSLTNSASQAMALRGVPCRVQSRDGRVYVVPLGEAS